MADNVEGRVREFLSVLESGGWRVRRRDAVIGSSTVDSVGGWPAEHRRLLDEVESCENATGTVWFWCDDDYAGRGDSAFTWDELERQSLDGADDETVRQVASFWRRHRPVAMSVEDGYAYLAIVVSGPNRGQIVTGREPMYEEIEVVCGSFDELMTRVCTGLPIPLVRPDALA